MLVGKFEGKGTWPDVGLLDRTRVPAPLTSVVIWPMTVPPIVRSKVLLGAAPVTLTSRSVTETPNRLPVLYVSVRWRRCYWVGKRGGEDGLLRSRVRRTECGKYLVAGGKLLFADVAAV